MMLLLHLIVLIVGYHEQGRLAVLVLMSLIAHDKEYDKKKTTFLQKWIIQYIFVIVRYFLKLSLRLIENFIRKYDF